MNFETENLEEFKKTWSKALNDFFKTEEGRGFANDIWRAVLKKVTNEELDNSISEAQKLLDWKENWDDEGAKAIKFETFDKVKEFLIDCDCYIQETFDYKIKTPLIGPCSNGNLNIFWKTSKFSLLITVHESGTITYYGEEKEEEHPQIVRGKYVDLNRQYTIGLYTWIYKELSKGD